MRCLALFDTSGEARRGESARAAPWDACDDAMFWSAGQTEVEGILLHVHVGYMECVTYKANSVTMKLCTVCLRL